MTHKNNRQDLLKLELLGIGSAKHRAFKANLDKALQGLGLTIPVVEVQDIDELLQYDIAAIPALLYNGHVLFQEEVPSVEELKIALSVLFDQSPPPFAVRQIIAPTDFSDAAVNAYHYAHALAELFAARLRVVHVHQPQVDLSNPYISEANGYHEKEKLLTAFARTSVGADRTGGETREILTGAPVEEIRQCARDRDGDLIVMGTTGAGDLLGRWFGSISSEVARRAPCPVLLIPQDVQFTGFRNMVYAAGYTGAEASVLPRVVGLARRFEASLHVVHVNKGARKRHVEAVPHEKLALRRHTPFSITHIDSEDVLEGLNWSARQKSADLLIMATTHRSFFDELFHRSVTRRMVFNTRIPLLVLHF